MRHFLCILLTLFSFIGYSQASAAEDIQNQIDILASDEFEGRSAGTTGGQAAANYIADTFKSYKLKPYFKTFTDTFSINKTLKGTNIIAQIEGSDQQLKNEPIIIGAHYDHIGLVNAVDGDAIANGANDNASGSVGVLQLAKRLQDKKIRRPILFILFDAEEKGLLGSKHMATKLNALGIRPYVVFNLEMIGVPLQDNPQQAYLTGYDRSNFVDIFNKAAGQEALIYLTTAKQYGLFRRSDNYPFYKAFNIPAHSVSTFDFRNYKYYHHVKDEPKLMYAEHILGLVEIWARAIEEIANHKENIIRLKE